jgi:hypothetical protein
MVVLVRDLRRAAADEPILQAAAAKAQPVDIVDTKKPERGPTLIIVGDKDHRGARRDRRGPYEERKPNEGVTELAVIPRGGHQCSTSFSTSPRQIRVSRGLRRKPQLCGGVASDRASIARAPFGKPRRTMLSL